MDKLKQLIYSKIPAGSFVRNVITLMTGTTFAQALTILVAPLLTRLYNPADFGVFALYTSIVGVLAVIACWRYELAIVLPENDEDAANLLVLSILICFGMTALTLLMVALFRIPLANLLGAPELSSWLWLLPLSIIANGLFKALNYWSTRRKQFKRLAIRQITQSTVMSAAQVTAGVIYPSIKAGGMIGGAIVGQLAATGKLAWQIGNEEGKQIIAVSQWERMKPMLTRYKEFPLYSSWAILLNTISIMLPALLLGYFFTPAVVGFFALGHRVLDLPMGVIGSSLAQVFFPQAAENHRQGSLGSITLMMFKRLVTLGMVPITLLTVVAPELFAIVFGNEWVIAGEYVRWLSLWIFFNFISSPISMVYMILEKQKEFLVFNILLVVTRILALVIGGLYDDALLSIRLFGISGFIMYLYFAVNILYIAGIRQSEVWSVIGLEILKTIPYIFVPIFVRFTFNNSLLFVLTAITAGIVFLIQSAYTTTK